MKYYLFHLASNMHQLTKHHFILFSTFLIVGCNEGEFRHSDKSNLEDYTTGGTDVSSRQNSDDSSDSMETEVIEIWDLTELKDIDVGRTIKLNGLEGWLCDGFFNPSCSLYLNKSKTDLEGEFFPYHITDTLYQGTGAWASDSVLRAVCMTGLDSFGHQMSNDERKNAYDAYGKLIRLKDVSSITANAGVSQPCGDLDYGVYVENISFYNRKKAELQVKYRWVWRGLLSSTRLRQVKENFLRDSKRWFPNVVSESSSYDQAVTKLIEHGVIHKPMEGLVLVIYKIERKNAFLNETPAQD